MKTNEMKLEIVVLPVSDVDRSKAFYTKLGWRLDGDFAIDPEYRIIQFTPPGSSASIMLGKGITTAQPGSVKEVHFVVSDIAASREELVARGIDVSEVFHDAGRRFHHAGTNGRVSGPDPDHRSYGSFASFEDPDGNTFVLQEVTKRFPGRVTDATFTSASDLQSALERAAAAHGKHEAVLGHRDEEWPVWYAEYMVREARGEALPS